MLSQKLLFVGKKRILFHFHSATFEECLCVLVSVEPAFVSFMKYWGYCYRFSLHILQFGLVTQSLMLFAVQRFKRNGFTLEIVVRCPQLRYWIVVADVRFRNQSTRICARSNQLCLFFFLYECVIILFRAVLYSSIIFNVHNFFSFYFLHFFLQWMQSMPQQNQWNHRFDFRCFDVYYSLQFYGIANRATWITSSYLTIHPIKMDLKYRHTQKNNLKSHWNAINSPNLMKAHRPE